MVRLGSFLFHRQLPCANKVNAGLVLGFIQFETSGFPFHGNMDKYKAVNDIPPEIIDKKMYVVAWCVEKDDNFDKK